MVGTAPRWGHQESQPLCYCVTQDEACSSLFYTWKRCAAACRRWAARTRPSSEATEEGPINSQQTETDRLSSLRSLPCQKGAPKKWHPGDHQRHEAFNRGKKRNTEQKGTLFCCVRTSVPSQWSFKQKQDRKKIRLNLLTPTKHEPVRTAKVCKRQKDETGQDRNILFSFFFCDSIRLRIPPTFLYRTRGSAVTMAPTGSNT